MRDRTQSYVEDIAAEQEVSEIDLPQVKAGLDVGRRKMEEMLGHAKVEAPEAKAEAAEESCPFKDNAGGQEEEAAEEDVPKKPQMMNEVGLMSARQELRKN